MQTKNSFTADLIKLYKKHKPNYSQVIECNKIARKTLNITRPKTKPIQPKEQPIPDIEKFMKALDNASSKDKLMFIILKNMGLKVSELVNIKLTDINLAANQPVLFIRQQNQIVKKLAIPQKIVDLISFYIAVNQNNIYLFESRFHKAYTTRGIWKKCKKYSTLAKLDKSVTTCDFRRYFLNHLASLGWTDQEIKIVTGCGSFNRRDNRIKSPETIREKLNQALQNYPKK